MLSSTLLNYSVVTQRKLYDFFTAGNWGDQASRTERLDASAAAISLPLTGWPFSRFTREDYTELYTGLYDGTLRVERYSDLAHAARDPERCGQRRELTRCAARGKQFVKSQCFDTARRTV